MKKKEKGLWIRKTVYILSKSCL